MALGAMGLSMALSGLTSGAKALQGLKQKRAADKIQIGKRALDPATKKAVADIQTRATGGKYAGQDLEKEETEAGIAGLLERGRDLGSPSQISDLIKEGMGQLRKGAARRSQTALQDRRARQSAATAALEGLGAKREAIEEQNIQEAIAQKQALAGAGAQNIQGALSDIAGAGANFASAKLQEKLGTKSASGQQNAGEDASLLQQPGAGNVTTKVNQLGGYTAENDPEYLAWKGSAGANENLTYEQWKAKYK